ncbi:MAG: universal stress protein [Actinomycetota bacterium]|nr:universal stress protein [Actinomycetota bacterium]
MSGYRTIMVAIDRSEQSDRAVGEARDLAKATGGVIHLFHLREHELIVGKSGGSFERESDEEAQALLEKELAVLREAGVDVVADVRRGRLDEAAQAILQVADEVFADVLVIGLRGPSIFPSLMLGGTSYKILHLAKRPVLVVP